jgi:hypothetical protein
MVGSILDPLVHPELGGPLARPLDVPVIPIESGQGQGADRRGDVTGWARGHRGPLGIAPTVPPSSAPTNASVTAHAIVVATGQIPWSPCCTGTGGTSTFRCDSSVVTALLRFASPNSGRCGQRHRRSCAALTSSSANRGLTHVCALKGTRQADRSIGRASAGHGVGSGRPGSDREHFDSRAGLWRR